MEHTMTDKYRRAIIQRIKDLRKERGITQIQMADKIGVKQSHISRMESGNHRISIDFLIVVITEGLEMSLHEFFKEELHVN